MPAEGRMPDLNDREAVREVCERTGHKVGVTLEVHFSPAEDETFGKSVTRSWCLCQCPTVDEMNALGSIVTNPTKNWDPNYSDRPVQFTGEVPEDSILGVNTWLDAHPSAHGDQVKDTEPPA